MEDESVEIKERSSLEVAERVLALVAIVARSQQHEWVSDWCRDLGVRDYLSAAERQFFDDPAPDQQTIVNFSWRAEALVSLVWACRRCRLSQSNSGFSTPISSKRR